VHLEQLEIADLLNFLSISVLLTLLLGVDTS